MMGGLAFLFGSLDALGNPPFEFLHGVAADAKLDQMKWHVFIYQPNFYRDQSEEAAAGADGANGVAGAGVRAGFGAGCFLAAANVGDAAGVGRAADGVGAFADGVDERDVDAVAATGSGVMMLTGGVEAALGNSALVGLPVGTPGISAATEAPTGAGGVFQTAEYRAIRPS